MNTIGLTYNKLDLVRTKKRLPDSAYRKPKKIDLVNIQFQSEKLENEKKIHVFTINKKINSYISIHKYQ
jgi:hypothetical protein